MTTVPMQCNLQEKKPILGLIEEITVLDKEGKERTILAKIDTGADSSSLDATLAKELSVGPVIKTKKIISSHGKSLRPVIKMGITLAQKKVCDNFTVFNRSHMAYKILIGRNILRQGFLIDPAKNEFELQKK